MKNNARTQIVWTLGASDTTMIVKTWEWLLFGTDYPIRATLEQYTNQVVTKREIIDITWISWDVFTITRAVEECVQNDSADPKTRTQDQYSFQDWDFLSVYVTEDYYTDIELNKLNKSWWVRDTLTADSISWVDDNWNESFLEFDRVADDGKVLTVNPVSWVSLETPIVPVWSEKSFELSKPLTAWELVQILNDWKIDGIIENIWELWTANVFNSVDTRHISATHIWNDKVFIAYQDGGNSNFWTWIVATISWTTISYWTANVFNSANSDDISSTLIGTDKVFISYRDGWNSDYWTWIVATISWTTISYWTANVFNSGTTFHSSATQIWTDKVFITYRDFWNSSFWTWRVATISWTTISYWTASVFNSASTTFSISATLISTDKVFIAYQDGGNSNFWTWIVWTISWTTISYWTAVVLNSADTREFTATQIWNDKAFIAYRDFWNTDFWTWIVATISWTTISYWTANVFNSASTITISATLIDTNKIFIGYSDNWNSSFWTWIVATINVEWDLTAWILQETWTTWETKTVTLLGWVSTAHTWLTPIWTNVYIQPDWTIWTTETDFKLWRIISATEINTGQNNI